MNYGTRAEWKRLQVVCKLQSVKHSISTGDNNKNAPARRLNRHVHAVFRGRAPRQKCQTWVTGITASANAWNTRKTQRILKTSRFLIENGKQSASVQEICMPTKQCRYITRHTLHSPVRRCRRSGATEGITNFVSSFADFEWVSSAQCSCLHPQLVSVGLQAPSASRASFGAPQLRVLEGHFSIVQCRLT